MSAESVGKMLSRDNVMSANDSLWTTSTVFRAGGNSSGGNLSNSEDLSENHFLSPINPYHPFAWPLEVGIVFIILYSMTTLLAIIGNITTIIVFTKGKRSKTDIRPFLLNLAFSDLIMAIFCIPFTFTHELLGTWVFSTPMCPIVVFLQTVSVTASVSTNMVVGIDRFHAIVSPLKSHNATSRYKIIILCIWVYAVSLSAVQLKVCETTNINGSIRCDEEWPDDGLRIAYSVLVLMLTYVIPLLILTITYSIVGCILWKRKTPGNADAQRDSYQIKSKKKVVKMLVTIVTFFGLCWLPLHTFILVIEVTNMDKQADDNLIKVLGHIYFVAHWLAMSNSFVNPLIYSFMNENFRYDLRTLLFQICPCIVRYSRGRHKVVKRRSRGNGYQLYTYTCANTPELTSNGKWLERSRTQVTRNGKSKLTDDAKRKMSSASC
ncbi:neuropeptide Y receptor type 5-like [Saccostrea cucullata]|uniref:neuropeptide Y receptor type 5-like n=1 Tax=Saccostrea cuccullata TaxID=36930 RepID=UPI002ED0F414